MDIDICRDERRVRFASTQQIHLLNPHSYTDRTSSTRDKWRFFHDQLLAMNGLKRFGIHLPLRQLDQGHPVTLDWQSKNSTVFLNNDGNSPGSLFHGVLLLRIEGGPIEIHGVRVRLEVRVAQKRHFQRRCTKCKRQDTELQSWNFVTERRILKPGVHEFPLSTLIPNCFPASIEVPALSVSYDFRAEVEYNRLHKSNTDRKTATFEQRIAVRRSLPTPNKLCRWNCDFPAAGINITSIFDSVFLSSRPNKVTLKLSGLSNTTENSDNVGFWKLWQGSWRLEETVRTRLNLCEEHARDMPVGLGAGLTHKQVRILGEQGIYSGWKSTDDGENAQVQFAVEVKKRNRRRFNYTRDTENVDGTKISHALLVELVFLKEYSTPGKPDSTLRTGEGRILRIRYDLSIIEDQGLVTENGGESLPCPKGPWLSPPSYTDEELFQATKAENHELV